MVELNYMGRVAFQGVGVHWVGINQPSGEGFHWDINSWVQAALRTVDRQPCRKYGKGCRVVSLKYLISCKRFHFMQKVPFHAKGSIS